MQHNRTVKIALSLLLLSTFLSNCAGQRSLTRADRCTTATIFADEQFYSQRREDERQFTGMLEFRDLPATPGGRDHRFFLNGTPVYSGSPTSEAIFRAAAGTSVAIHGKLVDAGYGDEIWSSRITSCR